MEETRVRDAALKPLSSFQELRDLSLRSTFLTDVSLHYLSSLPNLINLSFRDAVLTNCGLISFIPSATLKLLDLRGCWLLTRDAILSFCRNYPQIEVRHELAHIIPKDKFGSSRPSPSRLTSQTLWVNQKQRNISISSYFEGKTVIRYFSSCSILLLSLIFVLNYFEIDQRLKYSREELLALQYSSLYLVSPLDRGITTSQEELN
jgi:hypothetical protein